jgi:hypothetical protein
VPQPHLSTVLTTACDIMTNLAICPLEFEADPSGASILSVMPRAALVERSVGPYHRDRLPTEVVRAIKMIQLRMSSRPGPTELTLDIDRRWPRLLMMHGGVRVVLVMPEDAPAGYQPPPGDVTTNIGVDMALKMVANSLVGLGFHPPVSIPLAYLPNPRRAARRFLPVLPTIELDRHRLSLRERKRHNQVLRSDPIGHVQWWSTSPFGTGISVGVGVARIRATA